MSIGPKPAIPCLDAEVVISNVPVSSIRIGGWVHGFAFSHLCRIIAITA